MRVRHLAPALFGVLGVVMAFHPMVFSGLSRMETDPGDARHLNYVLEHGYQWATLAPGHPELWSPPVFFPQKNTAAYSETLLGVLPFYAPWRLLGIEPDTSLQLWTFTVSLLNYAAACLLLSRSLGLGALAASCGAFLFSFSSVRVVQSGHHHLIAHFFTISAVAAVVHLFRAAALHDPPRRRVLWIAVFFGSLVAQFYAGFYLAWLLLVSLTVAVAFALLVRDTRRRLVWLVKQHGLAMAISVVVSAATIWPMASHYLAAASAVGYRHFEDTVALLPQIQAWFNLGPFSWLYGGLARRYVFYGMPFEWEKRLGLGLVTSAVIAWGFLRERSRPGMRVLFATTLTLIVIVTVLPRGVMLWRFVFDAYPGAKAIRAVSRIGLVLLVPASVGLAYAVERLSRGGRPALLMPLGLLIVLEQGQTMPSYDKRLARKDVGEIARRIPPGCEAFFHVYPEGRKPVWEAHLDAMWAQMVTGVPTVNGYSSNLPPGWEPLLDNQVHGPGDEKRLEKLLSDWLVPRGRDPRKTCVVSVP
jgi:hypothetical protein